MEQTIPIMRRGRAFIAKEGYPFILGGLLATLLSLWLFWPLAILFGSFSLFSVYFFRDPEREIPQDFGLLLSPADGTVLKIEDLERGPYYDKPHRKISIFMSALNVHVNRIPCEGEIEGVYYHPGKFFVASLDKASVHNEKNTVVLNTGKGQRVAFTQIAGLVARRIVCYLKTGYRVSRGERYGMIRFGSRMEVSIPREWEILVKPGQKVRAVTTGLARMMD